MRCRQKQRMALLRQQQHLGVPTQGLPMSAVRTTVLPRQKHGTLLISATPTRQILPLSVITDNESVARQCRFPQSTLASALFNNHSTPKYLTMRNGNADPMSRMNDLRKEMFRTALVRLVVKVLMIRFIFKIDLT